MANNQARATDGDMLRSLLLVLIPVLAITWLLSDNLRDYPVTAVDWKPVLQQARAEAGWPVLAPAGLPEDGSAVWVPTRATWEAKGAPGAGGAPTARSEWRIGFVSPDEVYFEVRQADGPAQSFVSDTTRDGRQVGTTEFKGQTWERWESADDRTQSLVRPTDEVTTVVVSDAEFTDLEQFAQTLSDR